MEMDKRQRKEKPAKMEQRKGLMIRVGTSGEINIPLA